MILHCVICTGKPSRCSDGPDFGPTIFEYTKRTEVQDQQKVARLQKRQCQVEEVDDILEVPVQEEEVDTQGVQMVDAIPCTNAILKIDMASTGPELNNGSTFETQNDLLKANL